MKLTIYLALTTALAPCLAYMAWTLFDHGNGPLWIKLTLVVMLLLMWTGLASTTLKMMKQRRIV